MLHAVPWGGGVTTQTACYVPSCLSGLVRVGCYVTSCLSGLVRVGCDVLSVGVG